MVYQNYIIKNIVFGTLLTLLVLVSIGFFFSFVNQLDKLGVGHYGFTEIIQFVLLKVPGLTVRSLPMSMLIGTILSLGALANNNEIVVVQASGLALVEFVKMVLKAAVIIAVVSLILQQWVVAETETTAYQLRSAAKSNSKVSHVKKGVWLKDGLNIVHVKKLALNGNATDIQIFELDENNRLIKASHALSAEPSEQGWLLKSVKQTILLDNRVETLSFDTLKYSGNLSIKLLQSLRIDPENMSFTDLYQYQQFLSENGLESYAEKIVFWRKVYSPFSILLMCSLAVPFVVGSQRGGQAGQRLMVSIVIGLSFVVVDRFLVKIGEYYQLYPALNTLIPLLLFLGLNWWLLARAINKKD